MMSRLKRDANVNQSVPGRRRTVVLRMAIGGAALSTLLAGGCRNDAGNGAAIGGLLGAGAGAIIGHQSGEGWAGAGIGAAAGALTGYIIGNESDKHRSENRHGNYCY